MSLRVAISVKQACFFLFCEGKTRPLGSSSHLVTSDKYNSDVHPWKRQASCSVIFSEFIVEKKGKRSTGEAFASLRTELNL